MSGKLDFDRVARESRVQAHSGSYAYDELPRIGSPTDVRRSLAKKPVVKKPKKKRRSVVALSTGARVPAPKVKQVACPDCGCMVSEKRLLKHRSKAHGHTAAKKRYLIKVEGGLYALRHETRRIGTTAAPSERQNPLSQPPSQAPSGRTVVVRVSEAIARDIKGRETPVRVVTKHRNPGAPTA